MTKTKYLILRRTKILLNIIMTSLMIILMCEHNLQGLAHEILGIILFSSFIIHNLLNYNFYKVIFKGKVNKRMITLLVVNILTFITLIITIISSVIISSYLFNIGASASLMTGRSLHLVSTVWLFILISIHLGLHLNSLLYKFKDNIFFKIIAVIIILGGLFVMFYVDKMYEEMFLLTMFKDFKEETLIVNILKKVLIVLSISLSTYSLNNLTRRLIKK